MKTITALITLNGKVIVNSVLPVLNPKEVILSDLIRDEVHHADPSIRFSRSDIKAVHPKSKKNEKKKDLLRLLPFPVSVVLEHIASSDSPSELHVSISNEKYPARNSTKKKDGPSMFKQVEAHSRALKVSWESKFLLPDVIEFQSGYEAASCKQTYLQTYEAKEGKKKPSILEQIEAVLVDFLNHHNLKYVSGSGGEDECAKEALAKTINLFKFVHENRAKLSRKEATKFKSSPILEGLKGVIRSKACKSAPKILTKTAIRKVLSEAAKLFFYWPESLQKFKGADEPDSDSDLDSIKDSEEVVDMCEERRGEAIFSEIQNCIDVLAGYAKELEAQDARNERAKLRETGDKPSGCNTTTTIIRCQPSRKETQKQSRQDKIRYEKLDELGCQLKEKPFYTLFPITDDVMAINDENYPTISQKGRARHQFIHCLGYNNFHVGLFKFERIGQVTNWHVVFKMPSNHCKADHEFIGAVQRASSEAPTFLSCRQTKEALHHIQNGTGSTVRLAKVLLEAILLDGAVPQFTDTIAEQQFLHDVSKMIMESDSKEEMEEMVDDMRRLNCRANTEESLFKGFWNACARVIETENGSGAHERRHAGADLDSTLNHSFAPKVVSIPQLMRLTVELLGKEGKVEGRDFKIPNESWVYLQMSPNNKYRESAKRYTSALNVSFKLLERIHRDKSSIYGHWNACMKKLWRHRMAMLVGMIEDAWSGSLTSNTLSEPLLPHTEAIFNAGQDDKTGIPFGRYNPICAAQRQSGKAVVREGDTIVATDHDFRADSFVPSVTLKMNSSRRAGDSLVSGGKEGNGRIFVSIHDATLNPSNGMKHNANLHSIMVKCAQEYYNDNSVMKSNAYSVLLECDGGPDHNLTTLANKLAYFALFLVGNMDKLTVTRGCMGLSYLNAAERVMPLVNLAISCLSLRFGNNAADFLMKEVLEGTANMKATRQAIKEYDDEFPLALAALERRLAASTNLSNASISDNTEAASTSTAPNDVNAHVSINNSFNGHSVNDKVSKFFPRFGWFDGVIHRINRSAPESKVFRILYEDNEMEDITLEELCKLVSEASIPIGDVGFRFIKKFGSGFFSGIVTEVLPNGKRNCVYCDGDQHSYRLDQIRSFAKNKVVISRETPMEEDSDSDSNYSEEDEGRIMMDDEMGANDNSITANDDEVVVDETPVATPSRESSSSAPSVKGKFFDKLMQLKIGTTLEQHIAELKERPTAGKAYIDAVEEPKQIIENRLESMEMGGRRITVVPYPKDDGVKVLMDALKRFDSSYDPSFCHKTDLKKMSRISKFFNDPDHCCMTLFTLEFRLCGKRPCDLCEGVGRNHRTPNIVINGKNLREETCRYLDLPIPNPMDTEHYLSPEETRKKIIDEDLSLSDLLKFLPDPLANNTEKATIKNDKEEDKKQKFQASKVRAVVFCDSCNAPRCIYSNNCIGSKEGPTRELMTEVDSWAEKGYVCGNELGVSGGGLFIRRAIRCGNYIESQYYNPTVGTKGGRVVTDSLCAICFSGGDIVEAEEIRKARPSLKGKNPLPMCRSCFDDGMNPATSGGRVNQQQKKSQEKSLKQKQLQSAVAKGYRKSRKV